MMMEQKLKTREKKSTTAVGMHVRAGLAVAGVGCSLLTTTFGLFHVDTFLKVYQLDPRVFSIGSILYAIINALNDVGGAWLVDHLALSRNRSDLVGLTGCLFAWCAVTPFFRPVFMSSGAFLTGLHFVGTLALHDTLYSFLAILTGSIMSDDSEMTQTTRIRFSVVCKVVNVMASMFVARTGLYFFRSASFQWFVVSLAVIASFLALVGQGLIRSTTPTEWTTRGIMRSTASTDWSLSKLLTSSKTAPSSSSSGVTAALNLRQVVKDFKSHRNFWMWIGMELLLESQGTFNVNFRKTFMDELVVQNGYDKNFCDWMLSLMRPITTVCSLFCFVPIQRFGYPRVYTCLFALNAALSIVMLVCANSESGSLILAFLIVYPAAVASVASAGFALAMADMVLEMKHSFAKQNRWGEPSLAGLFMGANALFCKPCESILPILGAQAMATTGDHRKDLLFRVLVLPPLVFSVLQYLSWRHYNLDIHRVNKLRTELRSLTTENGETPPLLRP